MSICYYNLSYKFVSFILKVFLIGNICMSKFFCLGKFIFEFDNYC